MKRFLKRIYIVLIVAVFLAVVIYLPELDARILENQYVNQHTLVKQDKQESGIHYDLPVDKLSVFSIAEFSTEILSIYSMENLESQDSALLEELQSQISIWEKAGIIPELVDLDRLKSSFEEALYYNISNGENPNTIVSAWKLSFSKSGSFRYQFIIDANTYKIYSASVYGYDFYDFWLKQGIFIADADKMNPEKLLPIGEKIKNKLSDYYEAQSSDILSLSAVWDIVWEGAFNCRNSSYDITSIPFYIYYYPGYRKKEVMGGISIGISSSFKDMGIEYDTNSSAADGW